jgi:5'-nucleotidase
MSFLRRLGAAGVLLLVLASPAAAHKRHHHHHKPKNVNVQLLALNDFHGALQTTTTGGIRPPTPAGGPLPAPIAAGGAGIIGSYLQQLRKGHRNTLTSPPAT